MRCIPNLSGDSKQTLIDQQLNVLNLARALETALCAIVPHGRNYQLNPEGDFTADREAHRALLTKATEIAKAALAEAIRLDNL